MACSPVDRFNFSFLILTSLERHYVAPLLSELESERIFTFITVIFRFTIALAIFSAKLRPRAGFVSGVSGPTHVNVSVGFP